MSTYPRVVGAFADESRACRIVETSTGHYVMEVRGERDAMGSTTWRHAEPTESAFAALRAAYGLLCSARLDEEAQP